MGDRIIHDTDAWITSLYKIDRLASCLFLKGHMFPGAAL
jgi:hypothetical protein